MSIETIKNGITSYSPYSLGAVTRVVGKLISPLKELAGRISWIVLTIFAVSAVVALRYRFRGQSSGTLANQSSRLSDPLQQKIQHELNMRVYFAISCDYAASKKRLLQFFPTALDYNDPHLAEPVIAKCGLDVRYEGGKTFLHLAVEANRSEFVKWLLQKGIDRTLKDEQGFTALDLARESQCLTLCRILVGDLFFTDEATRLAKMYAARPPELDPFLFKCFLNSETQDVDKLIAALKKLKVEGFAPVLEAIEKFIKTSGTLIARFPRPKDQKQMHNMYGSKFPNYAEQQRVYGDERFKAYSKVLEGVKTCDWPLQKVYETLFIPGDKSSCFRTGKGEHCLKTEMGGRYRFFIQFTHKFYEQLLHQLQIDPHYSELKYRLAGSIASCYTFFIRTKDGKEILLTTVYPYPNDADYDIGSVEPRWIHTEPNPMLMSYLSELFEELKGYAKQTNRRPSLSVLKEKIAFFYWLSCHAALVRRRSSQYSLETHKLVREINGLSTGPLAQKYVLPDCVALSLPFSVFYRYYDELFETPPQVQRGLFSFLGNFSRVSSKEARLQ
jgi:hypothetical protein